MFIPAFIHKRLSGLGLSPFAAHRRRAGQHASRRTRAQFRLEGLEDRCLLSITEFPTSHPQCQSQRNHDRAPTATSGSPRPVLTISVRSTRRPTPSPSSPSPPPIPFLVGITSGPDGNLWFTEQAANQIGEINPTTHAITEFATPTANSGPRGITAGPDGNLWFTENGAGKIGMINPTTHVITEFPIPTAEHRALPPRSRRALTATSGSPRRASTRSVRSTRRPMPSPSSAISTNFAGNPSGITAGPDGNLWFTETLLTGDIGMINPTTHAITEFPLPNGSGLWRNHGGPRRQPLVHRGGTGQIGMINPTTHAITEFPVPYSAGPGPSWITAGPDGNLWFTDY